MNDLTLLDDVNSKTHVFGTVLCDVLPGNTLLAQLGIQSSFMENLAAQQARGPFVLDLPRSQYENNRRLGITNRTEWEVSDAITLINTFGYRDTRVGYNTESGTGRAIADGPGALPAGMIGRADV